MTVIVLMWITVTSARDLLAYGIVINNWLASESREWDDIKIEIEKMNKIKWICSFLTFVFKPKIS